MCQKGAPPSLKKRDLITIPKLVVLYFDVSYYHHHLVVWDDV